MARTAGAAGQVGSFRSPAVWGGTGALMVLPVIALRGVDPAQWDPPGDFVFLALLLAGVGLTYEAAARVSDAKAYRAGVVVALATALLSAWINLAVGIIGSEDNPANWIYAGVLAVAGAGAVFARFRPFGVARAMAVAAAAQILAFVIALVAGFGFTGPITVFFAGLWLISAWLFARAAREQGS